MKKFFNVWKVYFLLQGLLFYVPINAALQFPDQAYGKPKIFDQVERSYQWEQIANDRNFYDQTQNAWTVYTINEGVSSYEQPSKSSVCIMSDIHFMEDFYVADIKGDFALLFYYDRTLHGLEIPEEVKTKKSTLTNRNRKNGYIGWVNIDDLLLWTICPKTQDGIFKKIVVVKDVDVMTSVSANAAPSLYADAECTKAVSNVSYLKFYFALKKTKDGNVLVYENYQLMENMRYAAAGWLKYGEYIDWNTRICWEPAFGNNVNDFAYTFASDNAAYDYDLNNIRSSTKLSSKRKGTDVPRSPILEFNSQVAKLSVLASANGGNGSIDVENVLRQINEMKRSLSKINVVFVMDATNSMKSCFSAMSKAVQAISEYKYAKDKDTNLKFGVVVFRNYADEKNKGLVDMCQLTSDMTVIEDFLDNTKCYSASPNPQEAMFYGLKYAIENINWSPDNSNFIILVSDVTTKDPDAKGLTSSKIIEKLSDNKINLVAFQARSQADAVYQNFSSQVGDIIYGVLTKLGYPTNNIQYQKGISIYLQPEDKTKWPLRPMGYKFKRSNDKTINSVELEEMAEEIIKNFIDVTKQNISRFESEINSGGTAFDHSVCDELIRRRIIRKCEDLKGIIKVAGYATMYRESNSKQMFTPCVFLADKELNDLIKDLESVTKGTVTNRRQKLQTVCQKLILSYTGQKFDKNTIDTDFARIAKAIEQECGYSFFQDVKTHIANPNQLEDNQIDIIVNRLRRDIEALHEVQNDASSYKYQDGMKYYYVLLDDMPLVINRNE